MVSNKSLHKNLKHICWLWYCNKVIAVNVELWTPASTMRKLETLYGSGVASPKKVGGPKICLRWWAWKVTKYIHDTPPCQQFCPDLKRGLNIRVRTHEFSRSDTTAVRHWWNIYIRKCYLWLLRLKLQIHCLYSKFISVYFRKTNRKYNLKVEEMFFKNNT